MLEWGCSVQNMAAQGISSVCNKSAFTSFIGLKYKDSTTLTASTNTGEGGSASLVLQLGVARALLAPPPPFPTPLVSFLFSGQESYH